MANQENIETVTIRNSDGEITDVATLKDGVLDGETLVYSAGRISARLQFRGGKQNGTALFYDDAGQVLVQAHYLEGKLHGESLYFDAAAGKVMRKSVYQSGVLHGYTVDFYPSGKPREVTPYQNSIREGEQVRLTEEGKVTERLYFRQGRPCARPHAAPKPAVARQSRERRALQHRA
jgi:antitoxin component YwqK of YwqJK toxin-antitoxin module